MTPEDKNLRASFEEAARAAADVRDLLEGAQKAWKAEPVGKTSDHPGSTEYYVLKLLEFVEKASPLLVQAAANHQRQLKIVASLEKRVAALEGEFAPYRPLPGKNPLSPPGP